MPRRRLKITAFALLVLFCLIVISTKASPLAGFYFLRQDIWLLIALLALWLMPVRAPAVRFTLQPKLKPHWIVALLMVLICLAGHWLVLSGYDASRDEQMAVFDAAIFASGQLAAPLDAMWRTHADALNTMFVYPAELRSAWISAYLPMNAAIRAGIGLLTGLPELTGPLWTGLGALALWGAIKSLWPESREAAWLGMALYALSGQVLFAGMTAYAMPAHLALNLVWLNLFLKRRLAWDLLALGVGFVAVGLHQPLMHPMFAAPILLLPLLERDWKRAALYFFGYLAIGLFWFVWPDATWHLVEGTHDAQPSASVGYLSRLVETLQRNGWSAVYLMPLNFARFVAWNHPLLVPLAALGLFGAGKRYALPMALAGGVVLTFVVMMAILPYQGHGFGYRYMHGLIGNLILLAIFGWQRLTLTKPYWQELLKTTSLGALVILLPMQAWFAHGFYAAYAGPSAAIGKIDADFAVIDTSAAPFASDLVINRPALDNRPIRLIADEIAPVLSRLLCVEGARVALVPNVYLQPINAYFGTGTPAETALFEKNAEMLASAGCLLVPVSEPED